MLKNEKTPKSLTYTSSKIQLEGANGNVGGDVYGLAGLIPPTGVSFRQPSRNCDFELKNGSGFCFQGFIAGARFETDLRPSAGSLHKGQ
jgi:hypothetical protein